MIRRVRGGDIIRGVCSVPQALGEKIDSMRELTDFLIEHFPLIVYQGNPVRSDYNANWSKGIRCDFFDYDIDDGSTRAFAYALEGIERVPVFLGMER
ncbi:hypothetical protein GF386_03755 [Candidatus Pacearchaeota archaeon]|nr:hypothetical protein [Candidatus Pacearchaeota archaeon]MBD3283267.1 hypothetical protein [Candidatus Pacearchaeota archaeon]